MVCCYYYYHRRKQIKLLTHWFQEASSSGSDSSETNSSLSRADSGSDTSSASLTEGDDLAQVREISADPFLGGAVRGMSDVLVPLLVVLVTWKENQQ